MVPGDNTPAVDASVKPSLPIVILFCLYYMPTIFLLLLFAAQITK